MIYSNTLIKSFAIGCLGAFAATFAAYGQDSLQQTTQRVEERYQEPLLQYAEDTIALGFSKKARKNVVGATSAIRPDSYLEYDNSQWVRAALIGRITGLSGSDVIRGLGNAMIVVDGIPSRSIDLLNSEEIEQITVLKDANALAQYGAMGKNGVIVVTTKRGSSKFRRANVIVNYGISRPVSLPSYLGSADYMELFNEARLNDGLDSAFSQEQIFNYRQGTNPYRYPNVDYYSSKYLKPSNNFTNVLAEFSGGNDNTKYYVNLGYSSSGSLAKLNPDVDQGNKRFNVRGNIDFRVNNFISSSLDVVSIVNSNKSAHSDLFYQGLSLKPHVYAPLLPVSMIDTTLNEVLAGQVKGANLYDGFLLGGAQAYQNNTPIANILAGGYQESISRVTQVNNAIDIDLNSLAKGLTAKTYVSFDFYNTYALSVTNQYSVYEPVWSNDTIVGLNRLGNQDKKDLTENATTQGFITRYGFYGLLNYDKQVGEKHHINTSLIGFANNMFVRFQKQPAKNAHVAFQLSYSFDDKLLFDFSSAYVNSVKLPEGNRGKFSPSLGLAYVLSEENGLQNVSWLNYLKLRATAGVIYSDLGIEGHFMYKEVYEQQGGGYSWADGFSNSSTKLLQGRNNNFGYEQRKDINLGFESILFNSLWLEMNVFQTDIDDQVTQLNNQYPSYYADFMPNSNYSKDRYKGIELGINYSERVGSLNLDLGLRAMYTSSERLKVDEVYNDNYQYRKNLPLDVFWGLEDQGFYSVNDFDEEGVLKDGLAVPAFGDVQAGDIKYKDQNNDGVINNQDQVNIGRWFAPWTMGVNFRVAYKGLSLFVLGVGQYGNQALLENNYYWVDGDDKYSEVVRNRWTEENAENATFPRLSSQENNNNFRRSTFWMYDNSYFSISRAQLTYTLPVAWVDKLQMQNLSVYASGSNLLEFSEATKERQLIIGSSPMYRYFSVGLRAKF
ncbi:SusC/RagA family TonB-linked outer membrane protein [Porifericola rhodea]|uniref:SusC/RagA family TonB-linked outer membrane protein n=1 Tax=Porifericola rhodea TaxID=930972 RepID=UPI0026669360|nr:SusC/RagA family TonB-linked outer membrane protein [Porifericola rhodea]WKN31495.1 SusC/RagA family TonB-linked outer membrane protein [Porifericola rhodea]